MSAVDRAKANLKVHTTQPLNAEPPFNRLCESFVTAQKDLYIRTHGDVQHIAEDAHRLKIGVVIRAEDRETWLDYSRAPSELLTRCYPDDIEVCRAVPSEDNTSVVYAAA